MSRKPAAQFEHHPDHDHHTLLSASRDERVSTIASFLETGLTDNERCLCVVQEPTRGDVVTALRERNVGVDDATSADRLSFRRPSDLYLSDGEFDPQRVVERLERTASDAIDAGYDGLRIAGEMSWVLEHDVEPDRLERYESTVDKLFRAAPVCALCLYDRSRFPPAYLRRVLETHPRVVRSAESVVNCYYALPDGVSDAGPASNAIDRQLRTIDEQNRVADSLRERERCLSLLGRSTAQLREADPDEIERIAGELIAEVVDPALVAFCRYDRTTGDLRPEVVHDRLAAETASILARFDERTWEAFVEDEFREWLIEADGPDGPTPGFVFPVGRHGTFFVATPPEAGLSPPDADFVRTICGHTEAVLDRLEYERDLEARNAELAEKNERLERVDRINAVIREITRSLVDASTREEIERNVCTHLVEESCASAAWFGGYDPVTESFEPRQTAGDVHGYLDALGVDDEWTTREPAGRAARSRETHSVGNIYDGPQLAHWREQALKRGFQSVISLPICFDDSLYGVLSLYGDAPGTFDGEIESVLTELSDLIAHAINSLQRKRALITEAITELDVRVTDTDAHLVEFVSRHDCRVEIDELLSTTDGAIRLFATFRDVALKDVRTFARASPAIRDLEVLTSADGEHTCECLVTDQCLLADLLNHNAVPRSVRFEDGESRLVLHLPQEKRIREFVDMLTTKYPNAEAVGRRDREQRLQRVAESEAQLETELTDRQLEILKLAFHSGYFERPRCRTAEEIADSLDVSHPTVSRHLREAERRVFSMLFDGD